MPFNLALSPHHAQQLLQSLKQLDIPAACSPHPSLSADQIVTTQLPVYHRYGHYAYLLWEQFQISPSKSQQTIDQFLQGYSPLLKANQHNQVVYGVGEVATKCDQMKLADQLTNLLPLLTEQLSEAERNQTAFKPINQLWKQKTNAQLQNLQLRVLLRQSQYKIKNVDPGDDDQESEDGAQLQRIKTLLRNGLWGLLPELQERIARLERLESQQTQKYKSSI